MWYLIAALEASWSHPLRRQIWTWLLVVGAHVLRADTMLGALFPRNRSGAWSGGEPRDRLFPPSQRAKKLPYVLRNLVGEGAHCEVFSVGPRVPRGTALRDEDGELFERLHMPSCVGDMEVVSKAFRHTHRGRLLVRWNLETGTVLGVWGHDKSDDDPTKKSYTIADAVTTHNRLWLDPFLAEVVLNRIVTSKLVYGGLTPHFMVCQSTGINEKNRGSLLLERLDASIGDLLNDPDVERDLLGDMCRIDAQDILVFYVQLLHALHVAQTTLRLKHHDLHTENVFVRVLHDGDCWEGEPVMEYTHLCYHVSRDLRLYVPNTGLWAKIGDLGMASLQLPDGRRCGRGDMEDFNTSADKKSWGVWNLRDEPAYDMMLFFGDPVYERRTRFWGNMKLKRMHQRLRRLIFGSRGRVSRDRGRPTQLTRVTPGQILERMFGQPEEPWYDLRTVPDGDDVRVLDMGSAFLDLEATPPPSSSSPTTTEPGQRRKRSRRKQRLRRQ